MVYAAFNYTITDESGNIVTGALIEVRRESDNGLAALYSDRAGASPIANPFTDSTGTGRFHAAGSAYKVTATKGAFTRSFRYVPVGLAGESDTFIKTITANSGEGVSLDPTDPFNPILSGVIFTGDSGSGGVKGMVPAPSAGDAAAGKYLKASGSWATIADGGRARLRDFTAGGIYSPSSDVKGILVYLTGGGGGGAGAVMSGTAVGYSSGSGGNGGDTVMFTIDSTDLFSGGVAKQFEIIFGSAGIGAVTATTASGSIGSAGGDSTFTNYTGTTVNTRVTARGGAAGKTGTTNIRGISSPNVASTVSVVSGFTSLKSLIMNGGLGGTSVGSYAATGAFIGAAVSSAGGFSFWGDGAIEAVNMAAATTFAAAAGNSAISPGSGGGGGAIKRGGTTSATYGTSGGNGVSGKCLIVEFY